MKRLQFNLRLVAAMILSLVVINVAAVRASAQEVVASYADLNGTIIKYRVSDGAQVSRIQQVYRLYGVTYLPTRIAVEDNASDYVVFGNRYLARLNSSDGAILWLVDAGAKVAYTTYIVADIAVAGGAVFVSNNDPGGRISKYRASDGVLIWSVQRAVQVGSLGQLPLKLAAVGGDYFYAALGYQFLAKLSQRDGSIISQSAIPLTYFFDPFGVADLTAGGGFAYLANVDPRGTVRKFNSAGSLVWQISSLYRVGLIWHMPTKLAVVGSDPIMALYGDRYLARLRATDGQVVWIRDISLPYGGYSYLSPTDIAAIGTP
jgi:outer membrane protein assembly factor BamB